MKYNQKISKYAAGFVILLFASIFLVNNSYAGSSSSPAFPISIANWEPIAFIAVLVVIAIAAFIYMLSRFMFNTRIEAWAKMQIYEAFLSFVILLIFVWISTLFFSNPVPSFSSAHLVPTQCTDADTLFQLSACDLGTFNSDVGTYFQVFYWGQTILDLSPGVNATIEASSISGTKLGFVSIGSDINSFFPKSQAEFLSVFFSAILVMLILNQIQLMIISSSLLFLSLFLVIGLVARIFGVTRTFGGAMIALGIGLGFVFPLLTAITYGFISTQIGTISATTLIWQFVQAYYDIITTSISNLFGLQNVFISGAFALNLGYIIGGLTFIPFLNFLILDAFIIDFSTAIGERMSFMSLMGTMI